jgi:hypothetical protein
MLEARLLTSRPKSFIAVPSAQDLREGLDLDPKSSKSFSIFAIKNPSSNSVVSLIISMIYVYHM